MENRARWTAISLALGTVISLISGCTGVTSQPGNPAAAPSGAVVAVLKGAPVDGVVAFRIDVTGAALVGSNGLYANISNGVEEVEVRHLQLAPTLAFQTVGAPSGNYSALNMAFANPQITVMDSHGNVAILNSSSTPSARLTEVAVSLPFNLTLQGNDTASLLMDFDLRDSIEIDGNGNYLIRPVLNVSGGNSLSSEVSLNGFEATIVSVPEADTYNLQVSDTRQAIHLVTTGSTRFAADAGEISAPQQGQTVEVDATFQNDGSFLATRIDTISTYLQPSFRGVVIGLGQNPSGNSSLAVIVQE